jgi:hypothetical protein
MQDRINQVDETSCTARPDHTVRSFGQASESRCGPRFPDNSSGRSGPLLFIPPHGTLAKSARFSSIDIAWRAYQTAVVQVQSAPMARSGPSGMIGISGALRASIAAYPAADGWHRAAGSRVSCSDCTPPEGCRLPLNIGLPSGPEAVAKEVKLDVRMAPLRSPIFNGRRQPSSGGTEPAVEALPNRRRRLRRPAVAFHP